MRTVKIEIGRFGEPAFYVTLAVTEAAMLMYSESSPKRHGSHHLCPKNKSVCGKENYKRKENHI